MTDPKDDAPWLDTTYDGFDEEVLEIGKKFMETHDNAFKQLANPEDIWDESKMTPTGLGLESLEGTDLRTDYNLEAFPHVTRVEVIGRNGREFVSWDCSNVQVSLQDDKRTLKVFV